VFTLLFHKETTMPMRPGSAEYLGDGVYAEFDGVMLSIDLRGEGRPEKIYLEPEVFENLKVFGDKVYAEKIQLEVCENVEWLTVFGPLGRLDLSDHDTEVCAQNYCSKLHALLTEEGFTTVNAKGQRITCHGWNGFRGFNQRFGNVGTFADLTPAQADSIVNAIDQAMMFAVPAE
jgi:hypothetical protein